MSQPHCRMLQFKRFFRQCWMLLRHCCRKRQQCRSNIRLCRKDDIIHFTNLHFGRTLSTPLPAKSCGSWWFCALPILLKWPFTPCYKHTLTVSYDFWHDFADKGVLNVLGGVIFAVLELRRCRRPARPVLLPDCKVAILPFIFAVLLIKYNFKCLYLPIQKIFKF